MKTCGDCIFFAKARNLETGRALPQKAGRCKWQLVVALPMVFERPPMYAKHSIFSHTHADKCQTFIQKETDK